MRTSSTARTGRRLAATACAVMLLVAGCSNESSKTKADKDATDATEVESGQLFDEADLNQPIHEGTPERGGTITYGLEADVLHVSPNQDLVQPSDLQIAASVFDTLITFDDAGLPIVDNTDHHANQLADEMTSSEDLTTWTVKLRDDVEFSNGEPLTAQQVVDHTEWVRDVGACACDADAKQITSVTAPDEHTVVYELAEPVVNWPTKLNLSGLGMITESGARQGDPNPDSPGIDHLVGTGPFHHVSKSGDRYRVEANEHYYGVDHDNDDAQLPYLDALEFRILADGVTRLQAVQSGGVDIMQTADTKNLIGALEDPNLSVQPVAGTSSTIEVLNITHPPFGVEPEPGESPADTAKRSLDDPDALAARQAFAKMIDRNEINQKYYNGTRIPSYGYFPSSDPYFDPDGQVPRFDAEGASELIEGLVGAGATLPVKRMCIETPEGHGVFAILQQQGKRVGIDMELQAVDQAKLVQNVMADGDIEWDVTCFRSGQMADPDGLYNGLHSAGAANVAKYARDDVDAWLDEARAVADQDERKALYDKVQEQVAADVVIVPRLFDYFGNVFSDKISGLGAPSPSALGIIPTGGLYRKG